MCVWMGRGVVIIILCTIFIENQGVNVFCIPTGNIYGKLCLLFDMFSSYDSRIMHRYVRKLLYLMHKLFRE